jgi:hypothetical protein
MPLGWRKGFLVDALNNLKFVFQFSFSIAQKVIGGHIYKKIPFKL